MPERRLAVIVLAAGQGTRMKSATPKVLHRLAGLPLIQHVLETAGALSPDHLVAVVRHERDLVVASVLESSPAALIVDQDETPGTGRAVEQAVAALPADFDGDVVVVSADVPLLDHGTLADLLHQHRGDGAAATLLSAVLADATGYGRVVRRAGGDVDRIVEHKDADEAERALGEINSGTYVFTVSALRTHLPRIGSANAQNEKYVTDMVGLLTAADEKVGARVVDDAWRIEGINDRVQLAAAARRLNDRIVEHWQRAGVTVVDPQTTWIDRDVSLSADVEILPGTQLKGATYIAAGAVVGPDTTLVDTEVGEGAVVTRTDATLAVIGARASVGPFSYLRPGTVLGVAGKIGTFVETKNAEIGDGSKVPHLSYIGDTEVGRDSNIGAGTITANYDGVNKHRTQVGSHVRTGSHNVFVAPVRIGDGAYSGAGTVVRKDVPAGALALSIAPQRNASGWVEANRPDSAAAEAAARAERTTD
ncbi:bifunctional UDP-N-acetylglucosamine diphosphorylase/glucosamine-1-phosphate N-acetyltransferase GlmU [Frigoribacterium faeni]|uniref:Bifunctional protein GlmU n=1 Tax=Frigoribacterium faeni TaxID=145483 RepID=A0A7W3PIM7_9MICO|nr:bifunctional UDP-N-acetylglucosamine diphosphorylase/glucosamine-1-phosphate N-acetyltransferase GlmU [Frigoribacterium faeni]MBA8813570.1 bifunctional UDP-N-acetylglucosamine pyrophosphorylase/glucosamine-1-phosphate N-acetyltransferase [Frigoribacterium faeni]BFF14837.1 bifunctional UDP-N-acetylglucosamine diphosphorylase/glucosamine-1-phosphate N-acetyltransferase GlmU [Microbacterium flavescens]GEK84191.1 bifunctional protein GlmU [Frigoribacterium faeni]